AGGGGLQAASQCRGGVGLPGGESFGVGQLVGLVEAAVDGVEDEPSAEFLDGGAFVGVELIFGVADAACEDGGLVSGAALELPVGERGASDEGVVCGVVVVGSGEPALEVGVEGVGVFVGEDDVVGGEAVLEGVHGGAGLTIDCIRAC